MSKQRELKCRFWHKELRRWMEGDALNVRFGPLRVTVWHPDAFEPEIDPEGVLVEFTGLKDKNGKEIYEGDVVEHRNTMGRTECGEVIFGEAISTWIVKHYAPGYKPGSNAYWSDRFESILSMEVIGNIYQHPDLLPQTRVSDVQGLAPERSEEPNEVSPERSDGDEGAGTPK